MVTYGSFNNTPLQLHRQPVTTAKFMFKNIITETAIAQEQRICKRIEYLSDLSLGNLDFESCQDTQAFIDFKEFFANTAQGRLNSFLFKNPLDYKGSATPTLHGDNTSSQMLFVPTTVNGAYQIVKKYNFGDLVGYKTIHHVDNPTLEVFVNGIPNGNYTINNGVVQFNIIPFNKELTVSCEFFNEYRFGTDTLNIEKSVASKVTISNVTLVELPSDIRSPVSRSLFNSTSTGLEFGWEPQYTEDLKVESYLDKLPLTSRELRQSRFVSPKSLINIESSPIYETEKDNLLCAFIACKGSLLDFTFDGSACRFDNDELLLSTKILEKE